MSSIFCCPNTTPYKSRTLSHESKFQTFTSWAQNPKTSSIGTFPDPSSVTLAIQLVKQVNYGPLESKRYFVESGGEFVEVAEQWVVDADFQKLNTFKNFRCSTHNRFFEVNVYQKDPVNAHHWRADVARPAAGIDL